MQGISFLVLFFSFLKFNMASNSSTLEFTAAVRGFHVFRKKWKPASNEQLYCLQHLDNGYDVFSIKTCKADKTTLGYLPKEISRPTKFLLDRGVEIAAEIESSHYRRSPLIQGGLEICCKVSVTLPGTIKNHKLLDRYKEVVNKLYCEPKNEEIIGNLLISVPNENIHLNQPHQQQLTQKKVNRKRKTNEKQLTSKNDIRNCFNMSGTSKSKEQKNKEKSKSLLFMASRPKN